MTEPAIQVNNLGKRYKIGVRSKPASNFREALVNTVMAPLRRFHALGDSRISEEEIFWALKDVCFDVAPGEVVGVMGQNGAGKSTLLKILSRITEPTEGEIKINGRVGSLLEVGTGFHPDLTGRENVFLNGAILGMKRAEIKAKFDEIVAFAEIDRFLDTPVKRYSSGMRVRLGFAVAAHLNPEILIVDEVLAVGDMAFQKKCLGKMNDVAGGGRTVLFVSHNMSAVRHLCTRGIYLDAGKVAYTGEVSDCIDLYLKHGDSDVGDIIRHGVYKSNRLKVDKILVNGNHEDRVFFTQGSTKVEIEVQGEINAPGQVAIEVLISDDAGHPVGSFLPAHFTGGAPKLAVGRFKISSHIELPDLMRGEYLLSVFLTEPGREHLWECERCACLFFEGKPWAIEGGTHTRNQAPHHGSVVLNGNVNYGSP